MNRMLRRLMALLLIFAILPGMPARAEDAQAQDISGRALVTDSTGFTYIGTMFDGEDREGHPSADTASLTLSHEAGIGSLYLSFGWEYGAYTVTDNATGAVHTCGESMFLHEFIDLEAAFGYAPASVTLSFENGSVTICELHAFTAGETPAFVQKWQHPTDGATDLVLFSTHGDDEQIFFAGLLPYYAGELGYRVQVVYLTNHRNFDDIRIHEMLNGLWAVGVTAYPVFGEYNDFYVTSRDQAYRSFEILGWPKEQMVGFVVEQLRRFKPLVAIGHDFNGEYGHGQHMVYADLLAKAITVSMDETAYPETAQKYGVWDVPKTYFHLYEENKIVMDWDQPLENFGGLTAFKVTRDLGYPCHISQYWDFFKYVGWFSKASEVEPYSPCEYGLYRSTVGEDVQKNDFFENLTNYAEQERIAEEQRLEEERKKAEEEEARRKAEEEAARLEAERLKAEEEARLAEEQRKKEEQEHLAAEKLEMIERQKAQEQARRTRDLTIALIIIMGLTLALFAVVAVLMLRQNRRFKKSLKK